MTAEEAQPTLHAVYPETVYEVGMLGWHYAAIHAAWPHLLIVATLCTHGKRIGHGAPECERTVPAARARDGAALSSGFR